MSQPNIPETIQQKLARLKAAATGVQAPTVAVVPTVAPTVTTPTSSTPSTSISLTPTPAQQKLAALLAARNAVNNTPTTTALKSMVAAISGTIPTTVDNTNTSVTTELNNLTNNITDNNVGYDKYGKAITYNEQQLKFIQTAANGESCILIGAAGTGKTTCMRGAIAEMMDKCIIPPVCDMEDHKSLRGKIPGVILVSFTRRAVSNLRKAMSDELKGNCLTIHAALEYEPQYFEVTDPETGDTKQTMRFEPTRHAYRMLPSGIKVCVIDEASMVSVELFEELKAALPSDCVFIFLGDIQQLPPVFGSAILGYKMLELTTVELTEVYRQALESPIIRLAHRILSGKAIKLEEFDSWKTAGQLTLHPWKKKLAADTATITLAKFLTTAYDNGLYDPMEDMVLIPFNKSCGTIEINKHIANHIARKHKRVTHEIIAGFNRLYLSEGDKVLYEKEDAVIIKIETNNTYHGVLPQQASTELDYWGFLNATSTEHVSDAVENELDLMLSMAVSTDDEDRVRKGSHVVTVKLLDSEREIQVDTASGLNGLLLSFALTVHKSQGSEFRKVFFLLHQSHATMVYRELMYTAVTRAREELYVICEPESFIKGIESQRIKGNTLAEKAEFFKGKLDAKLA